MAKPQEENAFSSWYIRTILRYVVGFGMLGGMRDWNPSHGQPEIGASLIRLHCVDPLQASKPVSVEHPGMLQHLAGSLRAPCFASRGPCRFWPPSRLRCVMVGGRSRPLPANRVRPQVQFHRWSVLALSLQAWGSGSAVPSGGIRVKNRGWPSSLSSLWG